MRRRPERFIPEGPPPCSPRCRGLVCLLANHRTRTWFGQVMPEVPDGPHANAVAIELTILTENGRCFDIPGNGALVWPCWTLCQLPICQVFFMSSMARPRCRPADETLLTKTGSSSIRHRELPTALGRVAEREAQHQSRSPATPGRYRTGAQLLLRTRPGPRDSSSPHRNEPKHWVATLD